jgi:type IV secretion system protein VirB9
MEGTHAFGGVRARFAVGCCALWVALPASVASADVVPERGAIDSRIRVAAYVPDEVYRLRGYAGYQIDLQFEAGETFVGLGAGDIESLTFAAQENHLFLKPRVAGVNTNLTVLTSRRAYHFDYAATTRRPDPEDQDVVYVLRFTYPMPPASSQDASELARRLSDAGQAARNLDYWYCGSPDLKPVAAWDDGVQTHLIFGFQQELPAIFLRNDDGTESLVNFTVDGSGLIVHRVSRRLIVRRGKLTGCVVNAAFGRAAEHALSGTVTPGVERVTRGTHP